MRKKILIQSIKIWLTAVAISLVLFQIPLYYIYTHMTIIERTYGLLFWHFTINWLQIISLLTLPSYLSFWGVKNMYKPYWSARGFKIALLFTTEVYALFMLIIYFFMFNSYYIIPTTYVLLIFFISYAVGVLVFNYNELKQEFYNKQLELE